MSPIHSFFALPLSVQFICALSVIIIYLCVQSAISNSRYQATVRKSGASEPKHKSLSFFGIPFIFNRLHQVREGTLFQDPFAEFRQMGTTTYKSRVVGENFCFTCEPENVKHMLSVQMDKFSAGRRQKILGPILGVSILTADGDDWKHRRALLRPQFARSQVAQVADHEQFVQTFLKQVRKHRGMPFDVQDLLQKYTLDTSSLFLFGESLNSMKDWSIGEVPAHSDIPELANFANHLKVVQGHTTRRFHLGRLYFLKDSVAFRRSSATLRNIAKYYIKKGEALSADERAKIRESRYCSLYELLEETRDEKILVDEMIALMLAGRDTTSNLMSFIFYELSGRPVIWNRLREAVLEQFGKDDLSTITFESLRQCEYLMWVIQEALRMWTTVPANFRRAEQDVVLPRGGGDDGMSPIVVAKGTMCVFASISMHRNPAIFGEDADTFRPERWGEGLRKNTGWGYLPFNGGPRTCLGQQLALTTAGYLLARVAQEFTNLNSSDSDYPPRMNCQVTLSVRNGTHIMLS